jgi:hypothetical protein
MFKDEYKDSAELIKKNLAQRFFDIMMSSDLATISDTELKERLDGAIAAAVGENLEVVRRFRAGSDQEKALAEIHQAVDNNTELVVRNRTQAPQYLRGFDDDPEIYQKNIEKMYEQDRIWIGHSVPGLDINRLRQINKQDAAGDDEDAAGLYQYGDTSTFYRVTADGNRIKIERQNSKGGNWENVPVSRNTIPESSFRDDRDEYFQRKAAEANTDNKRKIEVGSLASKYETSPLTPRLGMGDAALELAEYDIDEIRQILEGWKESGVLIDGKEITDIKNLVYLIKATDSR